MRRLSIAAIATFAFTACSSDATSPDIAAIDIEAAAFGTALTQNGGYDAALYQERLINALPDELKLSDEQKAKIRSLVGAFEISTKSDREALTAILREAREATRNRMSRDDIRAILEKGAPLRERLAAAERKLVADIEAVLTVEQRAWIAAHRPQRCNASQFPPLSDAQKAEIGQLERAFRDQNKSDLEAIRNILREAGEAVKAGKSRADIMAILARGAPIAERLAAARKTLHENILNVLTLEQKASRCFPLG